MTPEQYYFVSGGLGIIAGLQAATLIAVVIIFFRTLKG